MAALYRDAATSQQPQKTPMNFRKSRLIKTAKGKILSLPRRWEPAPLRFRLRRTSTGQAGAANGHDDLPAPRGPKPGLTLVLAARELPPRMVSQCALSLSGATSVLSQPATGLPKLDALFPWQNLRAVHALRIETIRTPI